MTASIAGVLFDATGTLIQLRESVGEVYSRIAREHGVDLPAWRLDDAFERMLLHAKPRVFPSADAAEIAALEERWWYEVVRSTFLAADSTARFADATAFYAHLYRYYATVDAWQLVPGARTVLADLHDRELRLGVVSNFDQRLLDILEAFEISGVFETVMIPARARCEKPEPAIFEAALANLGLPAERVLFIGDDQENDLAAASKLGMPVLDIASLSSFGLLPAAIDGLAS